ncbi:MAG TPA: bis(5'-nucleosyl)-tetraphosphatase (symmetrical) YqeK [Rectinemataceae bacterium]|nr:bis(5'-nucleosyl)-tetraphosphatase (symmetrical) YqeK [Rectinemataceae bacterium]
MKSIDCTDCREAETLIKGYLDKYCKQSRIEHSISVAGLSSRLCGRFAIDQTRGYIAGLAHDVMKDRALPDQWQLAGKAAGEQGLRGVAAVVSRIEGEKAFADKIIHGPAGAVFLYEECGLDDPEMLDAIALHSSAAKTMSALAKIVFIADKLEPGRAYVTRKETEAAESQDLDDLLFLALGLSIDWLSSKKHAIAQSTLDLYNALKMRETAK